MQKKKGISLIVLIITMVVIGTITTAIIINFSESNVINNANDTANSIEVMEEKKLIQRASAIAQGKNVAGILEAQHLENSLSKVTTQGETSVISDESVVFVKFNKLNRCYSVDYSGRIEGPFLLQTQKYAGDLTKGGEYTGEEESPYIIYCIEDLVEFSQNIETYKSKYVILEKSLDFNDVTSYNDFSTTEYGDLNGDGVINVLKVELTKKTEGCTGFPGIASFAGNFNGNGNTISNLYQYNETGSSGLFLSNSGTIQGLGLKNITLTGANDIGGVVAYSTGTILSCFVDGISTIKGTGHIGLICGRSTKLISGCYSKGELKLNSTSTNFGGIVGRATGTVEKAYNIMEIERDETVGGIVGSCQSATIKECYHIGDITIKKGDAIGIAANVLWSTVTNCYNIGNMNGTTRGSGIVGYSGADVFNCYSIGKVKGSYMKGIIQGMNYSRHTVHCFGRRGDNDSLASDTVPTAAQIRSILSAYNNINTGLKENAKIGDECNLFFDDYFKTQNMIDELNRLIVADSSGNITETPQSVWAMDTEGINGGYPIFAWQQKNNNN